MTEAKSTPPRKTRPTRTVRDAAARAVDATTATTRKLAADASAGIEANPMGVLAGGIALGALIGAFVPRSDGEKALLRPVGKRLNDTARGAVGAARDTAKAEFDVMGLSRAAARDQVGKLFGGVLKALATAGAAAIAARASAIPPEEPAASPAPPSKPAPRKRKKATAGK